MKLVKEFTESSAYTFLRKKSLKEVEELIEEFGSDEDLINNLISKKYSEDKYFTLVDYINDNFKIRIWKK